MRAWHAVADADAKASICLLSDRTAIWTTTTTAMTSIATATAVATAATTIKVTLPVPCNPQNAHQSCGFRLSLLASIEPKKHIRGNSVTAATAMATTYIFHFNKFLTLTLTSCCWLTVGIQIDNNDVKIFGKERRKVCWSAKSGQDSTDHRP